MNEHLTEQFERALARYRGNRMRRMLKSPAHLLYSKVMEVASRRLNRPIARRAYTFWGGQMTAVFPEPVSMTVYRYGFFEEELTRIVLSRLTPDMIFFDIGAHFGYFSLLARAIVGHNGRVHSFEPTPSTFQVLRANVSPYPNVHPVNRALWSSETSIRFLDHGVQFSAYNSVQHAAVHNNLRGIKPVECEVQAITLDTYVRESGVLPDMIKIDAEGAELSILEGMPRILEERRPMITVEVGDKPDEPESKSRQLLDWLMGRGYRAYEWANGRIAPHVPKLRYEYTNILLDPS